MKHVSSKQGRNKRQEWRTVGIDLGDRESHYCALNEAGEVVARGIVQTTREGLGRVFSGVAATNIVIETGTHSCWVSRYLKQMGHSVVVANARELRKVTESGCKTDRNDAELLARLLRADLKLLAPVEVVSEEAQQDLAVLRARNAVVAQRTALINAVRGVMKSHGYRLPTCSTRAFASKTKLRIPPELRPALLPLIEMIRTQTETIQRFDHRVEQLAETKYPVVELLTPIAGVGTLTALSFVLRLGNPQRFRHSRQVGAYLGLVPRKDQSGQSDRQLPITKAGDGDLRRLLVGSAHYILGPFGPDCDLRRKGLELAARGGKNGKKRAVVAIARRLAVLMHHLWANGEVYDPNYRMRAAAVA